ncbi:MAG: hypothetical protein HY690_09210 [Chloroflexi bacterium]|nr:hypothetical protein [Chloroflexota bacterium]
MVVTLRADRVALLASSAPTTLTLFSLIVRGRTEDFSLERLLELVRRFGFAVDIRLSRADQLQDCRLRVTAPT